MSMHKLTAGTGYEYLTRQVAAMDATDKGRVSLADYYSAKGDSPGQWIGSGMAGLEGLDAGDVVTADQMHALFGLGIHPLAHERQAALERAGATAEEVNQAARIGLPFKVYEGDVSDFRVKVARALTAYSAASTR